MSDPKILITAIPNSQYSSNQGTRLREELPSYQIETAGTFEELRRLLKKFEGRVKYVVLDRELLFDTANGPAYDAPEQRKNGIGDILSEIDQLSNAFSATTILSTDSDEKALLKLIGRKLNRRFLALWCRMVDKEFPVHLADMIDALDNGGVYMVPEIVEIKVDLVPSHDPKKQELSFSVETTAYGPLTDALNQFIRPIIGRKTSVRAKLVGKNIEIHDLLEAVSTKSDDELAKLIHQLYICRKSIEEKLWDGDPCPPLFHVHIRADDHDILEHPIDLTHIARDQRKHLTCEIPIVWKMGVNSSVSGNHRGLKENAVPSGSSQESGHYFSATSFEGEADQMWQVGGLALSSIESPVQHCESLQNLVRYQKSRVYSVKASSDWQDMMEEIKGSKGRSICYVLSHGIRGNLPGDSAIASTAEDPFVSAQKLKTYLGNEKAIDFCFFNCCHLGRETQGFPAKADYFGGFLSEALCCGLAAEVVAHRWQVPQDEAKRLAVNFFRSHPRTVFSRATALFFARNAEQVPADRTDIFWLAPIHAVRHPI